MYYIESERMILHPLTGRYLFWFVRDREKLEDALNLEKNPIEINAPDSFQEKFFNEILTEVIPRVQKYADQYMWYTHWILVYKKKKMIAGGIGIHGEPDESGNITLSYYLDRKFEGEGLATEAVECLKGWLLRSEKVHGVRAVTPKENKKAQKVLINNGFEIKKEDESEIEWIFQKG